VTAQGNRPSSASPSRQRIPDAGGRLNRPFGVRPYLQPRPTPPVISFESKKDSETETKHNEFVKRMLARGYTQRQVRRLVEWYMRVNKAG